MRIKKWLVGERDNNLQSVKDIAEKLNITYATAFLLYKRGLSTASEAEAFLCLDAESFNNPFLLPDMEKACGRILRAVESGEKLTVYGDYDVDGITSTCVLYMYLKSIGANASYFIPDRLNDGYGVNRSAVERIVADGTGLIVTVDTGTTAVEEVSEAKRLGCDFVLTDHHECGEILPPAVAVVNPMRKDSVYPFQELAGVGVAFKLICAVEMRRRERNGTELNGFMEKLCAEYIDLVAIGTVADVMPLIGENRLIVSFGLSAMKKGRRRLGIRSLVNCVDPRNGDNKEINASFIGYQLAPRLNSAGRMGSAERAVELFLAENKSDADAVAAELCDTNTLRRDEEQKIREEVNEMIALDPTLTERRVIVLSEKGWHHGVIGIIATYVQEKYNKPTIIVSFDGETGKGSGRSVNGFNLVGALRYSSEYLVKYGGHEQAAGLTVRLESYEKFVDKINEYAEREFSEELIPTETADFELTPDEITIRQADELTLIEPCGEGNGTPAFVLRDITVEEIKPIGAAQSHVKITFRSDYGPINAVFFRVRESELHFAAGEKVDVLFNLNANDFGYERTPQLLLKGISPSRVLLDRYGKLSAEYRKITETGRTDATNIPDKAFFAQLYRSAKTLSEKDRLLSLHALMGALRTDNYIKTRLGLEILNEAGAVKMTENSDSVGGFEMFDISFPELKEKAVLEETWLYRQLNR